MFERTLSLHGLVIRYGRSYSISRLRHENEATRQYKGSDVNMKLKEMRVSVGKRHDRA